jgi:predicted GTPase
MRIPTIIMGAAGRDFHNFNTIYRDNDTVDVVAFTAAQIPDIAGRAYPAALAGPLYPRGIPIHVEGELRELIRRHHVQQVVFSYSDVSYAHVMHRSALVNACGADFVLLGAQRDDDHEPQAGRRGVRRAHRGREEPDDPQGGRDAAGAWAQGRGHPPPDAVR